MRRWQAHLAVAALLAVLSHLALVWLLPRFIMNRVMHGPVAREMNMHNRAAYPPAVDASARRIVMPSPDLLYAICVYDLASGPVRVRTQPGWPQYWSVSLYAANSDNVFVINDRQASDGRVDLWLRTGASAEAPPGARAVNVPSTTGLVLMRLLMPDAGAFAAADAARRTLGCEPAGR